MDFNMDFYDENDKLIEADEDGSINLLPYIHQKLTIKCTFRPVHAIRMIEIELPVTGVFKNFNRHKAWNYKVRTLSKKGSTPWFKNEYDRVGIGQKHMRRRQ